MFAVHLLILNCLGGNVAVADRDVEGIRGSTSGPSSADCTMLVREGQPLSSSVSFRLTTSYGGIANTQELGSRFSRYLPALAGILLNTAVLAGRLDLLKGLLNVGAVLDVPDREGSTPLYKALEAGFEDARVVLVKCGASPNFVNGGDHLLHRAAQRGSVGVVEGLVALGAEVDSANSQGYTPLYVAIKTRRYEVARLLVSKGSSLDFKATCGKSLLHLAVLEDDLKAVDQIIAFGGRIDTEDNYQQTPFFTALSLNYSNVAERLQENGANVDFVSSKGNPILLSAVSEGLLHVVVKLLDLGANVSAEDASGLTALHRSIERDDVRMLMLLLEFYDKLHKVLPDSGDSPMHFAVRKGAIYSAILLLEFEDLSRFNKVGLTPFALAVYLNQTKMIKMFLENKPGNGTSLLYNVSVGNHSYSPLHVAVSDNNMLAAANMIQYGAYVNRRDSQGKTSLWCAVEANNSAMIEMLVSKGAKVTSKVHHSGDSMLHIAVYNQCVKCADTLIRSGADVNAEGYSCLTPLLIAAMLNNEQLIKLLISKGANVNYEAMCGVQPFVNTSSIDGLANLKSVYKYLTMNEKLNLTEKAVEYNQANMLQYLIGQKGNFNTNRRDKLMHIAVKRGNIEAMKVLIKLGLAVSHYTAESLLSLALENRQPAAMETLIRYGADININIKLPVQTPAGVVKKSWSLLHQAAYIDGAEEASVLLDYGMDVNVQDEVLWTPLHVAAMTDHVDVGRVLIERGADLDALTNHGYTPHYIAHTTNSRKIEPLLRT